MEVSNPWLYLIVEERDVYRLEGAARSYRVPLLGTRNNISEAGEIFRACKYQISEEQWPEDVAPRSAYEGGE